MKELIVLSILFSFGIGKENEAIFGLSALKERCERFHNIALAKTENRKRNTNEFMLKLRQIFTESSCIDQKILNDEFSNFSLEIEKINLPLLDWIHQTSIKIRALDVYLNQLQMHENLSDTDLTRVLPYSFVGNCRFSFPNEKPDKGINTNDIYAYQNKINCERVGSEVFQCGSGECIDFNKTCDGTFDCWDGSDELGACEKKVGCEECQEFCALGPRGPQCVAKCPAGFEYSMKFCPNSKPCYSLCLRKSQRRTISAKCLVGIISNLLDTSELKYHELKSDIFLHFLQLYVKCPENRANPDEKNNLVSMDKINSSEGRNIATTKHSTTRHPTWRPTTSHPTWHPTSRHPTWHPTTRHPTWHPTWHPTTRHPTWHPTTRHPTWHPTTRHPTWHPTTGHPTWHPTTRHPTWHPTTRHTTWHPTTRHPTWHPTTSHPTWHPTTRHPTWHPTTRHPTWHPTTGHPTWHPTTRHPTWHPTTRHTTWHPTTRHPTWHPTTSHPTWHPTTRHPTWHPTTGHPTWHPTTRHPTWHPTTRHPTWHPTTRHTTWHTTPRTTTWNPTASGSIWDSNVSDYSTQINENKHRTTKHTTPHSTTSHTRHTTKHHTTKHTTKHTTHHTTPTSPTTNTTPRTTTTSKSTTSPTTTTTAYGPQMIVLQ